MAARMAVVGYGHPHTTLFVWLARSYGVSLVADLIRTVAPDFDGNDRATL
jgi:hypothetical protein